MSAVFVEPYHLELIDGQEVEKPLPKKLHVAVQSYLLFLFLNLLRERYLCASELNFWCGPDRLVPDITVVRRGADYRDGDLVEAPALVVEILSPGQTIGSLMDKASRLVMAGGAKCCWVIWPERKRAWTFTLDGNMIEETESLTARFDDVPVIVPLADLWAELDRA